METKLRCIYCGGVAHRHGIRNGKYRYECMNKEECGDWFSLSQEEIEEITEQGNYLDYYTSSQKTIQKLRDQRRIEKKAFRDSVRAENAIEEYIESLIDVIKYNHPKPYTIEHEDIDSEYVGIFCLADLHFNELVDLPHNKYDFHVAAKRLKKYVIEAKKYFKVNNVKDVVIVGLGDYMNSSRRKDEMLNMATNLSKASFLAVLLLEQVIVDLNKDFNITYTFVSGNESRIDVEYGYSEMMLTHNYDWNISEMLKLIFRGSAVAFIDGPVDEKVINVNGKNFLLIHGDQLSSSNLEKSIAQVKGKWADRGVIVDYVLHGHLHSTRISDFFARSASLVGANAYSDNALQLTSRASQNIGIVSKTSINFMKIDLQEFDDVEGYNIYDSLCAYISKSEYKAKRERGKYYLVEVK